MIDLPTKYKSFAFTDLFIPVEAEAHDCKTLVNSVTAKTTENGINARVSTDCYVDGNKLTVTVNGRPCVAFYQAEPFIFSDSGAFDLKDRSLSKALAFYLIPIINKNGYKFSYSRKATLDYLNRLKLRLPANEMGNPDYDYMEKYINALLPCAKNDIDNLLSMVFNDKKLINIIIENNIDITDFKNRLNSSNKSKKTTREKELLSFDASAWHEYRYDEIFDIRKGFYNKKPEHKDLGTIPFLGATDSNNGVTELYTYEEIEESSRTGKPPNEAIDKKLFPGNAICVTNDGSVGYAYYQKDEFTCSHSVNPLYRKDGGIITPNIAMFICTVIMQDRYRWDYGRKWRPERMAASLIKLPSKQLDDGTFIPDWEYMENFIAQLPYSDCINA